VMLRWRVEVPDPIEVIPLARRHELAPALRAQGTMPSLAPSGGGSRATRVSPMCPV
jgi:hypothetical protein